MDTDEQKLLRVFNDIGIYYRIDRIDDEWTAIWLCAEGDSLAQAQAYDHLIEFRNGKLASY